MKFTSGLSFFSPARWDHGVLNILLFYGVLDTPLDKWFSKLTTS